MGISPDSLCEGCLEPHEFRAPMQLNMIKVICRTRQEIRLIKQVGLPTLWYKPKTQLTTGCLKLLLLSYDGAKYDESDSQNTTGDTTGHHLIKPALDWPQIASSYFSSICHFFFSFVSLCSLQHLFILLHSWQCAHIIPFIFLCLRLESENR